MSIFAYLGYYSRNNGFAICLLIGIILSCLRFINLRGNSGFLKALKKGPILDVITEYVFGDIWKAMTSDFWFNSFITRKITTFYYVVGFGVFIGLTINCILTSLDSSFSNTLGYFSFNIIFFFIIRLSAEAFVVIFKIGEGINKISNNSLKESNL